MNLVLARRLVACLEFVRLLFIEQIGRLLSLCDLFDEVGAALVPLEALGKQILEVLRWHLVE